MNKKVKSLLIVLCALIFVAAGIFATLAYLNDTSDEVNNVVTVGDVDIELDEALVSYDEYYEETVSDTRVITNDYNLIPGVTYTKDPTVHVLDQSEPAYIFVRVYNGIERAETDVYVDGENIGDIAKQMEDNGWVELTRDNFTEEELPHAHPGIFVYNGDECDRDYIVNAKADGAKDLVVFEKFAINPDLDYGSGDPNLAEFEDANILVKAFAIQALGGVDFNTAVSQAAPALAWELGDPLDY